jgi:hypothetical protein
VPHSSVDASGYVLSAQKNLASWSFTGEYSLINIDYRTIQGEQAQTIEMAYLQAQYRLQADVTIVSRYEMSVLDRDNRNESDSHNLMLGARWLPAPNWIIEADIYGIRGTSGIPINDNPGAMFTNERTEIFAVMIGYRF